jgi:predicted deacetylase
MLVSLSGIDARSLDRGAELSDELAARGVPMSLLLAPRVAGADQPAPVLNWVRERRAGGDALLQHGYDHTPEPRSLVGRRRAEFATLPAHEAGLRLIAAGTAMERLGLRPDGFVPPRWLASPGTVVALRRRGFAMCADFAGVRDLRTGTVHRGRVLGFGVGERTEPWWCFALVMGAARTSRRGGLVRLAADTADLVRSGPRQALLDAVDIALHHGAQALTYPELVMARSARAA